MQELQKYLKTKANLVEQELSRILPSENVEPSSVHRSMRYTTFLGGKRIRPVMMLAIADVVKGNEQIVLPAAAAIEMIHTSSLILDDLPCMDDAKLRRGKKTNHLVFGEDTAVLAAFALLNLAFETTVKMTIEQNIPARKTLDILKQLTLAVGSEGLIGGQSLDLEGEGKQLSFDRLEFIHSRKTGSLFTASGQIACILSNTGERDRTAIELYTKNLGLAFQVVDDILDATSDSKTLGKDTDKDSAKTTFVSFASVEEARDIARELIDFSIHALEKYGARGDILRKLAYYVIERKI